MGLSMAGLGDAMVNVAQSNRAMWHDEEMANLRAELETNKAKALADYQVKLTDDSRKSQVSRRDEAKSGLINEAINSKYAGSDAAVSDAQQGKTDTPMTNDQLAVIAQSKDADAAKVRRDPMTGLLAGYATGDVSDKEMAGVMLGEKRLDRQEKKDERSAAFAEFKLKLAERSEDRKDRQAVALIAKMAASGGSGSSKLPADAEMVEYLVANKIAPDKVKAYAMVKEGKHLADSYSQKEEKDPLTGETKVTTTRKGAGAPSSSAANVDALFPIKK